MNEKEIINYLENIDKKLLNLKIKRIIAQYK